MAEIALREVRDEDLDGIFEQMRDPEGVWMAAFTGRIRTTGRTSTPTWPGSGPRPG